MSDPLSFLTKASVPIGVITTIIGGSAWLTTTHNRVEQVSQELAEFKMEYRSTKDKILDRLQQQDEKLSEANAKLSGLDAKLDLVITAVKNRNSRHAN